MALYLIYTLVLAIICGQTLANPLEVNRRRPMVSCPSEVDISKPILPFIDYPALKRAANDAITVVDEFKITGQVPKTTGKGLKCDRIRVRKEWRKLTRQEKKGYIKAEKCLMRNPSYGLTPGNSTFSFFDGLVNSHSGLGVNRTSFWAFHGGPKFLPWHRWVTWIHGYSLEKLCGYQGPIPYWDYTIDAGPDLYSALPFSTDPEIGFGDGGSVPINELGGRAGGYIVDNGAFAHYRPNYPFPHYLVRNFTPDNFYNPDNIYGVGLSNTFNKTARARVTSATDFWQFETMIDGLDDPGFRGIHSSPHFAFGGDAQSFNWLDGTPWEAKAVFGNNDPLFYIHHANVDYIWWEWQNKKEAHQYDFRGPPDSMDNVCDLLPTNDLGPEFPVGLVLKTEWYPQCYTYDV